ncbi:uncharacterized protein E5676_scaffold323G001030 [Cucumis melo var. makuwa]|uniref:Uncharacterized protein n=2 Tax=Cucumis melo TaxID=3656 RepID=A0A5A7U9B5_CUCMM|nr:uncharacterized protein E6C27_scaffold404G00370 [Cucumis melo var. makuwa]TYK08560.1 uncharacterized protein E5676_scaffold323G001030 [Cucumis melo var. makuwa]
MDAAEHHNPQPPFFDQILPPRLEDAGLEDPALPPDSIREAFFKAASAVKSRATALLSPDDDDEDDPWSPTSTLPTDIVTGILPDEDAPAICATRKGLKLPEFGKDEVVIGGMEERRGKACVVDGLEGLEIGDEAEKEKKSGKEEEKPILGEGFA